MRTGLLFVGSTSSRVAESAASDRIDSSVAAPAKSVAHTRLEREYLDVDVAPMHAGPILIFAPRASASVCREAMKTTESHRAKIGTEVLVDSKAKSLTLSHQGASRR